MTRLRRLAVALGDRYGVGPELVARLSATLDPGADTAAIVVGDGAVWDAGRLVAGSSAVPEVSTFEAAGPGWSFLARPNSLATSPMGQLSPDAGREVLATLGLLADAAKAGQIDGIVYAPLNKQAMKAAGHAAGDELDFFHSHLPATGLTGEINILNDLWTSRVTSHVPLGQVAALITREHVGAGIDLLANALRRSGKLHPRLAVAALNPHAGEGGAFGMEEIETLAPAIADAQARGLDISGPFPCRHGVSACTERRLRRRRHHVPRSGSDRAEAARARAGRDAAGRIPNPNRNARARHCL